MRKFASLMCGAFLVVLALAGPSAAAGQPAPAGPGAAGADILNMDSCWRWHVELRPPQADDGGKLVPIKPGYVNYNWHGDNLESPAPPEGWTAADFDDSDWPRSRLGWLQPLAVGYYSTFRGVLRGKFTVTDPAAVGKLQVSFGYRGGAAVYLNGQEVCREHLPAGALAPDAAAEAYPAETFVDAAGKPIQSSNHWKGLAADAKKDLEDRVAKRQRQLNPVEVPAKLLRKGTNVLAIEVRCSHYHPSAVSWFNAAGVATTPWWVTAGLSDVRLQAAGPGAAPNTARPKGLQLWAQDRCDRVSFADYGDPNEPLRPARLAGARNGSFALQVVLGSTEVIAGASFSAGALKGPKGEIPAANLTALYGLPDMAPYGQIPWFQGLGAKPPAQAAPDKRFGGSLLPVLIRVQVPKDAAAGTYRGAVKVSAADKSFDVPVELDVADWTIPDPKDYRTYIGVYQSPTSLAMQYKVKEWSEEHWKLMDKSFELLGRVGNKMVNVSIVDETQFGEPEGMVVWVKKADGSYDYDFAVFDRYLKLALKHCGKLNYVCLQVWHAGGWEARPVDNKCTVQVRDGQAGQKSAVQVPRWGTPEAAAFWKPFLAKAQEHLAALGLDKAMTLGILSCSTAPEEVFKTTAEAFPDGPARWQRGCHVATDSPTPYRVSKGSNNVVSLHEHCYGMTMVSPYVEKLPPLHELRGWPGTAYFRVSNHEVSASLLSSKLMTEQGLWCQKQGIGRICLDFWPVLKGGRDNPDIYNRYPHSSCAQREPSLKKMTWPGPEGAEPNINSEAFAEGLQETEALLVISEAAAKHEAKIGKELADKCRSLLRERLMFCHARDQRTWNKPFYHLDHYGWRDLARRTFGLAGEVAAKIGK